MKRIVVIAILLIGGYLALLFGRPYYQYLMMYQSFDDAVDVAVARIHVAQSYTEMDVTGEVVPAVEAFLQKRAQDLDLALEGADIRARTFAGRLVVRVAWSAPVTLLDHTVWLDFNLEKERPLSR